MNLHNYKPYDPEQPLNSEHQELFCQEYFRLDVEREILQRRARRIAAYKFAYKDGCNGISDADINMRAIGLLREINVAKRLEHLYDKDGSGVEHKVKWSKVKAEDELLSMIISPETKDADKLKAINMLNEINLDDGSKKEGLRDTVQEFFKRIGKGE